MGRKEQAGVVGKVAASGTAGFVAAFVGSEMLQRARRQKDEYSLLALICLVVFFSVWSSWEVLQVRQHLGLAPEYHGDE